MRDTCGCDMGGDCECLCDAVAAYAKACLDKGVCVDWRAPDFCREYPVPHPSPPRGQPWRQQLSRWAAGCALQRDLQRDPEPPRPMRGGAHGRLTGTHPPSHLLRLLQLPHAGGRRPVPVRPGDRLHVALPAVPLPPAAAEPSGHQHRRCGRGEGEVGPDGLLAGDSRQGGGRGPSLEPGHCERLGPGTRGACLCSSVGRPAVLGQRAGAPPPEEGLARR